MERASHNINTIWKADATHTICVGYVGCNGSPLGLLPDSNSASTSEDEQTIHLHQGHLLLAICGQIKGPLYCQSAKSLENLVHVLLIPVIELSIRGITGQFCALYVLRGKKGGISSCSSKLPANSPALLSSLPEPEPEPQQGECRV